MKVKDLGCSVCRYLVIVDLEQEVKDQRVYSTTTAAKDDDIDLISGGYDKGF